MRMSDWSSDVCSSDRRCLFLLDQGDAAAVLRHYDSDVRGDQSEEYLDISNAVALLWRLEQRGIDVGGRWIELAEKAARLGSDHQLVFADAHYMMALAAAGPSGAAEDRKSTRLNSSH